MIRSVTLDPEGRNVPYVIGGITETAVNGTELGLGGYLDIGLIDTMQDLIVNFIGAFIFSIIGFFYVKNRGKGIIVRRLVPTRKREDRDFLRIVAERTSSGAAKEPENELPDEKQEERAEDSGSDVEKDGGSVPDAD